MPIKNVKSELVSIHYNRPEGNLTYMMGVAVSLSKQLGYDKAERNQIIKEMTSGDYINGVAVFMREFGNFVDFVCPAEMGVRIDNRMKEIEKEKEEQNQLKKRIQDEFLPQEEAQQPSSPTIKKMRR